MNYGNQKVVDFQSSLISALEKRIEEIEGALRYTHLLEEVRVNLLSRMDETQKHIVLVKTTLPKNI